MGRRRCMELAAGTIYAEKQDDGMATAGSDFDTGGWVD